MDIHMNGDIECLVDFLHPTTDNMNRFADVPTAIEQLQTDLAKAITDTPNIAAITVAVDCLTRDNKFTHTEHRIVSGDIKGDEAPPASYYHTILSTEGGDSDTLYQTLSSTSELMFNQEEQEPGQIFSGAYGDINVSLYIEARGPKNESI